MSNENTIGDWKPQAVGSVNGVYDYGQYIYPSYSPTTTKRTVTTVYEYDSEGKVIKQTVTEETVTQSTGTYRHWNTPIY